MGHRGEVPSAKGCLRQTNGEGPVIPADNKTVIAKARSVLDR